MKVTHKNCNLLQCLVVFCTLGAITATLAFAGIPADESLLGLSEQALRDSLPEVTRILKPKWGPHGVRGMFVLNKAILHGQTFDALFYFKNRRLERIEHRRIPPEGRCETDYVILISSLNLEYGAGIGTTDSYQAGNLRASIAWRGENFAAMAYKLVNRNRCELLVAFEPRQDKDASTL